MAIDLPAEYDFSALGNVIDQIENLLRNRRAIELDTLQLSTGQKLQ